ncbi:MAG: hypothetical protein E4H28_05495 [Gemmatimonadales bacterium]|nr:MAG: hypothetical protein E4H28_05495 [Gemmatimonadales bacterium]
MRVVLATDDGVYLIRWLAGERAGTVLSRALEGRQVASLAGSTGALYAAIPEIGVLRSNDGGGSWDSLASLPSSAKPLSLAVLPSGDLLVGTEPAGLSRSSDSGSSWTEVAGFGRLSETETWSDYGNRAAHVQALAFDAHDAARLYAGVEIGGAYRSDDNGITWAGVNDGMYDDIHDIAIDPRDGTRLFAATGGGLYVSTDRGADWRPVAGELGEKYCTRLLVIAGSRAAGSSQTLFLVGTADGPPSTWGKSGSKAGGALWVSRDSGSTWSNQGSKGLKGGSPVTALATDPAHPATVLVGTAGGNLVHGHLMDDRWHRLLYGVGAINAILVV